MRIGRAMQQAFERSQIESTDPPLSTRRAKSIFPLGTERRSTSAPAESRSTKVRGANPASLVWARADFAFHWASRERECAS